MTQGVDEAVISQMYEHCKTVYAKLLEDSREEEVVDEAVDRVWEGYFTNLFAELGLSTPYYTSVRKHLIRMGCIEQLRRGGGNTTSKWRLVQEPTEDLFRKSPSYGAAIPKANQLYALEQQIRLLSQRVGRLETAFTAIVEGRDGRSH